MLWRRWTATALALAAAALFVATAAVRRLNFDEALLLRAGRLELDRFGAEPPFLMPASLAAGAASRLIGDPGHLFLALRLAVAVAVLAAFGWLVASLDLSPVRRRLAVAIVVAQGSFATHGLEFRYDAALLVGLLVAVGGVARATPAGLAVAGAALAFVALHHVKGLLVAVLFAPVLLLALRATPAAARRTAAAAAAVVGLWLLALWPLGGPGRWLGTATYFARVGVEVDRLSPAEALGPAIVRDAAWWLVAIGALLAIARASGHGRSMPGDRVLLYAALVTLALVPLHPHPWPYALALPAPFLALLVARAWPPADDRRAQLRWSAGALLALALQLAAGQSSPLARLRDAFRADRAEEVAALRRLRAEAGPGDRVLDPSGLVYFLPPCTKQWYLDTLFQQGIASGRWMSELGAGIPAECGWSLYTYRLRMIPASARAELPREFAPVGGALLRRRSDTGDGPLAAAAPTAIDSFW